MRMRVTQDSPAGVDVLGSSVGSGGSCVSCLVLAGCWLEECQAKGLKTSPLHFLQPQQKSAYEERRYLVILGDSTVP